MRSICTLMTSSKQEPSLVIPSQGLVNNIKSEKLEILSNFSDYLKLILRIVLSSLMTRIVSFQKMSILLPTDGFSD